MTKAPETAKLGRSLKEQPNLMERLMNTHVSRRTLFAATAMAALPSVAAAAPSPVALAIRHHEQAFEALEVAVKEQDRAEAAFDVPRPAVRYGQKRERNPETDEVTIHPLFHHTREAIERDFARREAIFTWALPELRAQREEMISELETQRRKWKRARAACGLEAADRAVGELTTAEEAAFEDVLAVSAVTVADIRLKTDYLSYILPRGCWDIDQARMMTLLASLGERSFAS